MSNKSHDISTNRYPGVKPFATSENMLFFGRETDLDLLNTLIFIKQTVVLYGKSGYGKSSLINAGIIPKLKENEQWTHFSIRFNNYSEKDTDQNLSPFQTVRQRLSEQLAVQPGNILDSLIPAENSMWYWIKQQQLQKRKLSFIIFFDQFEELFTYPKEQVSEFSEQLSQLLYSTLPINFRKKIAELEDSNAITDELHEFLYEKPEIKVIFSVRSDRLALLNSLTDKHPSILQNFYELDALNIEDARKAIIGPARLPQELGFETPDFVFTDKAIDKILASIANPQDNKIEAATLQIVCRYVENSLVRDKGMREIDADDLGDITDIFQQYYQGILSGLTDTEKAKAQKLIEDELIDGNRRNPLSEPYIKAKFGLSDALLSNLEQSSLLRKERDAAGRILYEVSHDTLINAINKVAETRRTAEEQVKQANLQQQIDDERQRSAVLLELNNKARIRTRIAFGLTVVCILLAAFSLFAMLKARKETANAERMQLEAEKSEKLAKENFEERMQVEKKSQDKDKELNKRAGDLEMQRQVTKAAQEYGIKIYTFTRMMLKVEQSISNADRMLARSPDLVRPVVEEGKKLLSTTDSLPKEIMEERRRLMNKLNDLSRKLNSTP